MTKAESDVRLVSNAADAGFAQVYDKGRVHLLPELWFFLPPSLWRDVRFWRCLERVPLDPGSSIPCDHAYLPTATRMELAQADRIRAQIAALEQRVG